MTLWSATAVMTGAAFGFGSLFGARFLLGLSESGAFPVASRGMQLWFPRVERGRIQGTTHFFSRFAVAVTPFIAGSILLAFGWRAIFYIFGSLGIVWAIAFSFFYRDLPEDHNGVNPMELARIRGVNPDGTIKTPAISHLATPWKQILLSPNMWFISLGYFCFFFGTNFYLTWYPTYLREHLHMSIRSLGIWGSVPLFAGMAGDVTGGSLSDMILKTTGNAKLARRVVAAPGFLLASVFVVPAALTANRISSILFLAASFFFLEWVIGPAWAVPMDVGGQFSGTVTGVMNMVGALGGASTAVVYGSLFNRGFWVAPFLVSAGVMLLGALIWTFLINPEQSVVERPVSAGAASP
jgi:sugar phosphate permease